MGGLTRIILILLAFAPFAFGATPPPQTKVRLLLSHEVARPGETITAALELASAPLWHTYWRNAGDAGLPTTIEWELPAGMKAGQIQWPVPHKLTLQGLAAYAYEGTEYLLIPLTISAVAKPGAFQLKAKVDWLECEKTCHPQKTNVVAALTIGDQSKASPHTALFENAREQLPKDRPPFPVTAKWEKSQKQDARTLVLEWTSPDPVNKPDFFPFESDKYVVESESANQLAGNHVTLRKNVTLAEEVKEWPQVIAGLVIDDTSAKNPVGFAVALQLPKETAAATAEATPTVPTGTSSTSAVQFGKSPPRSLWVVLGLAFLGGLVLNIMPCVLPVIALKILSFVNQSGSAPSRARQLGIIYALGVLASFAVLAGIVIAVKRAGQIASWGMQFQNPVFLIVMITLVTLISLNLFGVFEITLGGKALGAASELASKEGAGGAFFNGVLATVLGTSCTAPFLAAAIGYALGQPAYVTILVFLTMGVGLAFPYVLLTWNPALLKMLPKPGAWMEKFKVAMGFPMLATGIWLYSVAVKAHFGTDGALWLAMYLLMVAAALWVFGAFVQRGSARKPFAILVSFAVLAFAVGFVLEKRLNWRNPSYETNISQTSENTSGTQWQKWSPQAVAKARAEGRPILVDFTAAWCLNCQANKISSIEIAPVEKKLKEINAVALIGDFTRKDPVIAQELQRFERSAVPLVLVYPADANQPPMILPEILTPNMVLEALDRAAAKNGRPNVLNASM
jgi:thiol:disulfide interchange protein